MEPKVIKNLEKKILVSNILIVILLIILFNQNLRLANLINNEISFRNYLEEAKINPYINPNDVEKEKLEFPNSFYFLILLTFVILINNLYYVIKLTRRNKEEKVNKHPSIPIQT